MKRILIAAVLLTGFAGAPALAQTKVGDWQIEKRQQDEHCNATRAYKDEDDDDRQNVIVVTYSPEAIVIVLVYEGWEWEKKDEIIKADVTTDKGTLMKKAKWQVIDKETLRGIFEFKQSILDTLSKGKKLTLDFDDGDDETAEFNIPRAGEALAALKFCEENRNAGVAAPAPAPAPQPAPQVAPPAAAPAKGSKDRE
jgi:Ni/Co efflux regulator RcnB